MLVTQLWNAYRLDAVDDLLRHSAFEHDYTALVHDLSCFMLKHHQDITDSRYADLPLWAVMANLIARGNPTRPSVYIEQAFADVFPYIEQLKNGDYLTFNWGDQDKAERFGKLLFEAFHVVDPRLCPKAEIKLFSTAEKLKQGYHYDFKYVILPAYFGAAFNQLLAGNRLLSRLLEQAKQQEPALARYLETHRHLLDKQKLDFTIESPYGTAQQGIIIEIDQQAYPTMSQKHYQDVRQEALQKTSWGDVISIGLNDRQDINHKLKTLKEFTQSPYFQNITKNYQNPLYAYKSGLVALQLALSPLAIARIQAGLLYAVRQGLLKLKATSWKVAVVERDVPCAYLAVEDFKRLAKHLFMLEGKGNSLPEIELSVFYTKEFAEADLRCYDVNLAQPISNFSEEVEYDLLLDCSVLLRDAVKHEALSSRAVHCLTLRSAQAVDSRPEIECSHVITYANQFVEMNNGRRFVIPEYRETLEALSADILRRSSLTMQQLELINRQLRQQSCLSPDYLPQWEASILAGLLQAGICLNVLPERRHEIKSYLTKQAIRYTDVSPNTTLPQSLFLFASLDQLQYQQTRQQFETYALQQGYYFASALVYGAEMASEWHYFFRPIYYQVGNWLHKHCLSKNLRHIPVTALAAFSTYAVVRNIKERLLVKRNLLYGLKEQLVAWQGEIDAREINSHFDTLSPEKEELEATVVEERQAYISQFIRTNLINKQQQLIVCLPCREARCDAIDTSDASFLSKLQAEHPHLNIASPDTCLTAQDADIYFMALDQLSLPLRESWRFLLFLTPPVSLSHFVTIINHLQSQAHNLNCLLLFDRQTLEYNDLSEIITRKGELLQVSKTRLSKPDIELHRPLMKQRFRGIDKETRLVNELLTEIRFRTSSKLDRIADHLERRWGVRPSLQLLPAGFPYSLHLLIDGKTCGYIDYRTKAEFQVDDTHWDYELCRQRLLLLEALVAELCPEGQDTIECLQTIHRRRPQSGIELLLNEMERGEQRQLEISLVNDKVQETVSLLNDRVAPVFDDHLVIKAYSRAADAHSFISELQKTVEFDQRDIVQELIFLYAHIRCDDDTLLLLYRMLSIGLIDHYTLNRDEDTLVITFTRHEEDYYLNALYLYLHSYLSEEAASREFELFKRYKGHTSIQKALYYVINFTYQYIFPYHQQALDSMLQACTTLPQDKPAELHENAERYFTAKYASRYHTPNLISDTQSLTIQRFDLVECYLREVGDLQDSYIHLERSTSLLLNYQPENYVLLILKAYASFLLYHSDREKMEEAIDLFVEGFVWYYIHDHLPFWRLLQQMQKLLKKMSRKALSTHLINQMKPLIITKLYNNWLTRFNLKFLGNYADFLAAEKQ